MYLEKSRAEGLCPWEYFVLRKLSANEGSRPRGLPGCPGTVHQGRGTSGRPPVYLLVEVAGAYRNLSLHAWERETAQDLLGSGNLENFHEWPLTPLYLRCTQGTGG